MSRLSVNRRLLGRCGPAKVRTYATTAPERASSLRIHNPRMRSAVLDGDWKHGPPSLKTKRAQLAYNGPKTLKDAFPLAYEIIQKEKARHYEVADKLKEQLEEAISSKQDEATVDAIRQELDKHLIRSEINDPEVAYNHRIKALDMRQPVYRHLARRDWKSYDMLVTLQRIEQLHVIPDTLPTLEPKAHVRLQFPTVINKWVTPGEVLRNSVCTRTPIVTIQEFDEIPDGSLYTLLVVDPDTPDIANDSFTTTLHWAVSNIPLSNVDPSVDTEKSDELVPFLPPHPEKNGPDHRYCVWAFRQATKPGEIRRLDVTSADASLARENFDIRAFVESNQLEAVGAHVWRCRYDLSTDEVREKFGLGTGIVFDKIRR